MEDKKMKEWVDNKIKELKNNGEYYYKRGTTHLTIEDIEKKCEDQIVDKEGGGIYWKDNKGIERQAYHSDPKKRHY